MNQDICVGAKGWLIMSRSLAFSIQSSLTEADHTFLVLFYAESVFWTHAVWIATSLFVVSAACYQKRLYQLLLSASFQCHFITGGVQQRFCGIHYSDNTLLDNYSQTLFSFFYGFVLFVHTNS